MLNQRPLLGANESSLLYLSDSESGHHRISITCHIDGVGRRRLDGHSGVKAVHDGNNIIGKEVYMSSLIAFSPFDYIGTFETFRLVRFLSKVSNDGLCRRWEMISSRYLGVIPESNRTAALKVSYYQNQI